MLWGAVCVCDDSLDNDRRGAMWSQAEKSDVDPPVDEVSLKDVAGPIIR